MAIRPVFIPNTSKNGFVESVNVKFEWFPGFSVIQKKKSINSLHKHLYNNCKSTKALEISSKSDNELGVAMSAFNLLIKTKNNKMFSVETAFQSSKIFENGGPFLDLLNGTSREAKKDPRLKESGKLITFKYFNREWPLEPKTLFYDWLYINALALNEELSKEVLKYDAFTDIEFNPEKSINCQARSAALFVALSKKNLLDFVLSSTENYLDLLGAEKEKNEKGTFKSDKYEQASLFNDRFIRNTKNL